MAWVLVTNYQIVTWLFVLVTIYPKKKKLGSTYPKTLNSKARLWNGKMLGTHSVKILVTNVPLYAWHEWYVAHMNKTKSRKFFYECIQFFIKNSDLCWDKNWFWFRKMRSIFLCRKNSFWHRKAKSVFIK